MYDVIVVGARCAGSSIGLLLARSGLRVLILERSTFPKDTLNGHGVLGGAAHALQRWGLLDRLLATGCQPFSQHRYDFGPIVFTGNLRWPDGERVIEIGPRRYILDTLLADAAAVAGAEVRYGFCVDELLWGEGRVVGIRGDGIEERAALVIGADGFRSGVAAAVGAAEYETIPPATCVYYSHWSGIHVDALEISIRPGNYSITLPSHDGLTAVFVGWQHAEFPTIRRAVEGHFMRVVDQIPRLSEQVRNGQREEPFRGTADTPMFLRVPHGPGWALLGDAGCRVDPITGQGMTDAFRDAEFLADAILAGLGGKQDLQSALADYHLRRDTAVLPMYRYTAERARLAPPSPEMQLLLRALVGNQEQIDRFLGVTAGSVSMAEFFAPDNIARILGGTATQAA